MTTETGTETLALLVERREVLRRELHATQVSIQALKEDAAPKKLLSAPDKPSRSRKPRGSALTSTKARKTSCLNALKAGNTEMPEIVAYVCNELRKQETSKNIANAMQALKRDELVRNDNRSWYLVEPQAPQTEQMAPGPLVGDPTFNDRSAA